MAADGSVVIEIDGDSSKFKSALGKLGNVASNVASGAIKGISVAAAAAGTAVVALGKKSVEAYADYEQLVGGVETLFKESNSIVEEYAANAYKSAGISANAYMETVTSFSASLLQSLGGDTDAAAKAADTAITDMADNANKMGTSMESIQVAYQGFAKQNYTMLDNLKLGYGGTKEEMARLLADAEKLSGQTYDISNLNDVYEAIHVVQTELGITGTTAKEASTTIQGSAASMGAAWNNLLVGLSDDTQNFDELLGNLIDSVGTFAENLIPRIEIALGGIAKLVEKLAPQIAATLPRLASNLLPKITEIAVSIVQSLLDGLTNNLPQLASGAVGIVTTLANGIIAVLPQLAVTAVQLLGALVNGIAEALPTLIPAAVNAIITLVQGLIDNIPMLIDAALKLIMGLAQGLIYAIPVLIDALPTLITSLIDGLLSAIPQIIQAGIYLLTALVDALPEIITSIVQAIPEIINGILTALTENLPLIIQAGIDLLVSLIQALPTIITTIVQAIPEIIGGILDALIGNIDKIIMAGVQIFVALVENLPQIIIEIVKAIPPIITGIVDAIGKLTYKLVEAGGNLIKGLWEGISNAASWLWDKVTGWASGLIDGIKGLFGIHSPSTVFAEIGQNTIKGFENGVDDEAKKAEKHVMSTMDDLSDSMSSALDIHFPSRKLRDLVGVPAMDGMMQGFESGMSDFGRKMQMAVDAETATVSANIAAQTDENIAKNQIVREVHTNNRTVEKIARVEGDGITDELIRLLGLKLKAEDRRAGMSFA